MSQTDTDPRRYETRWWPSIGIGSVTRESLLETLADAHMATVFAPLGFGKTTLLVQHAERQEHPVIWVTLDRHDDDAVVFITKLVGALERIVPADPGLREAVAAPGASPWARLVALIAAQAPTLTTSQAWRATSARARLSPLGHARLVGGAGARVLGLRERRQHRGRYQRMVGSRAPGRRAPRGSVNDGQDDTGTGDGGDGPCGGHLAR